MALLSLRRLFTIAVFLAVGVCVTLKGPDVTRSESDVLCCLEHRSQEAVIVRTFGRCRLLRGDISELKFSWMFALVLP